MSTKNVILKNLIQIFLIGKNSNCNLKNKPSSAEKLVF